MVGYAAVGGLQMKLPVELLEGMGGKRSGITVISFIAMAMACVCGIVWGLTRSTVDITKPVFCKFAEPKPELKADNETVSQPRIPHGCGACGRG